MAQRYRFGIEEFERLFQGVTGVELLDGEVYQMSPIGPKHAEVVARLVTRFAQALGDKARVWPQNPVRLPPGSEPQPDIALLKPKDYWEALPSAEDILLLVEVSESSLDYDRNVKLPLYARSGIPEVWILDLLENRLHVFRHPKEGLYTEHRILLPGEEAEPLHFPGVRIPWLTLNAW
ncbi:Uma2 family endonuclease [Thermus sp. SYSU G05001]|uniref:Uma2 family endonuclease n=1 Tax=Thermus brevis TaxID=2862456 RepID=A0ABS7A055_9DEIN|nr:Uma2 family endonuclease [Thermus brevis]MBW6394579.1 Uma2 family endonuclease [Thermus brevis]